MLKSGIPYRYSSVFKTIEANICFYKISFKFVTGVSQCVKIVEGSTWLVSEYDSYHQINIGLTKNNRVEIVLVGSLVRDKIFPKLLGKSCLN